MSRHVLRRRDLTPLTPAEQLEVQLLAQGIIVGMAGVNSDERIIILGLERALELLHTGMNLRGRGNAAMIQGNSGVITGEVKFQPPISVLPPSNIVGQGTTVSLSGPAVVSVTNDQTALNSAEKEGAQASLAATEFDEFAAAAAAGAFTAMRKAGMSSSMVQTLKLRLIETTGWKQLIAKVWPVVRRARAGIAMAQAGGFAGRAALSVVLRTAGVAVTLGPVAEVILVGTALDWVFEHLLSIGYTTPVVSSLKGTKLGDAIIARYAFVPENFNEPLPKNDVYTSSFVTLEELMSGKFRLSAGQPVPDWALKVTSKDSSGKDVEEFGITGTMLLGYYRQTKLEIIDPVYADELLDVLSDSALYEVATDVADSLSSIQRGSYGPAVVTRGEAYCMLMSHLEAVPTVRHAAFIALMCGLEAIPAPAEEA